MKTYVVVWLKNREIKGVDVFLTEEAAEKRLKLLQELININPQGEWTAEYFPGTIAV